MSLDGVSLADAIHSQVGYPSPNSNELKEWGKAIVKEINDNAVVSNSSGTVTGTCPPTGGALQDGAASGGVISGLDGLRLANDISSRIYDGTVPQRLEDFCKEIVQHVMNFGVIDFATGNITGNCTNTADQPGPLENGAGAGGQLSGLNASTLADDITTVFNESSTPQKLLDWCIGLVDYLQANAEAEYPTGSVTGTCPAGGGPLQGGTGTGGVIL